jgi:hypothetical protein
METITTDHPVTQNRSIITRHIADFWDKTSQGWQTIWGPHTLIYPAGVSRIKAGRPVAFSDVVFRR